jgi:hypothetical protein
VSTHAGTRPVQVVYLGGLGRSGSTLLERMLGELPGVCPAGEVVHVWGRGVLASERCGCGTPFLECPFWRKVGDAAFGGWDQVDLPRLSRLRRQVDRNRFIPLLASPVLPPAFGRALQEYLCYYQRLYAGLHEVSGCPVVVDSSKLVSLAFCLRWSESVNLRLVQAVRDSRAVAHSWARRVSRPDSRKRSLMVTHSPASAAARWDLQNGAIQLLAALGTPTLRVRYEDLVDAPAVALQKIADFAGTETGGEPEFVGGEPAARWVDLTAAHTASGNPMRFQTGRIPLRRDDEWRSAMPAGRRRVVTALTFPLLARYGYLRGGDSRPPLSRQDRPCAVGHQGGGQQ